MKIFTALSILLVGALSSSAGAKNLSQLDIEIAIDNLENKNIKVSDLSSFINGYLPTLTLLLNEGESTGNNQALSDKTAKFSTDVNVKTMCSINRCFIWLDGKTNLDKKVNEALCESELAKECLSISRMYFRSPTGERSFSQRTIMILNSSKS